MPSPEWKSTLHHRTLPFLLLLFAAPVLAAPLPAAPPLEHADTLELVGLVNDAAVLVAEEGVKSACALLKQDEGPFRYDDVYVFLLDLEGNALCHPARPTLEGTSLLELYDRDGRPIFELMLRELDTSPDGWVHYLWPRPGSTVLTWKTTFIRRIAGAEGREVVVGSGAYDLPVEKVFIVDRVERAAQMLEERGRDAFADLRGPQGGFVFLDVYVFVMSATGEMLVHAQDPALEGPGALAIEDPNGVHPGIQMLEVLEKDPSGWVGYLWPKPGDEALSRKESYVRRVEVGEETWIVGAGVYLDD